MFVTVIAWSSCCPADVQFPAVTLNLSVQHLTTFVLDRKDGMITVDDGIRRLRLLDAKGKVWTQEMLLQVEEKMVSLIDLGTKVRLKTRIYFWFCFLWGGVVCLFVLITKGKKRTLILSVTSALSSVWPTPTLTCGFFSFRTSWRTSRLARSSTARPWWTPAATTPSWLWSAKSRVRSNPTSTCSSATKSK